MAVHQIGVLAAGTALVAHLRQPLRIDGQAEALLLVRDQQGREVAALEVLGDQRVIRRLDAVLHRQIQRRGCLAAAAHADQDHVRRVQVARGLAVVMRQREIDRLDPVVVLLALGHIRETTDAVVGLDAEFVLQRRDEGAEHVQHQALAVLPHDVEHLAVHQRGEDDGPLALALAGLVDLAHQLDGLVGVVDEGAAHVAGFHRELGQDGVTEGFGGDAGAIRDEEHGVLGHEALSGRAFSIPGTPCAKGRRLSPTGPRTRAYIIDRRPTRIARNLPLTRMNAAPRRPQESTRPVARRVMPLPRAVTVVTCAAGRVQGAPVSQHHGVFPCLMLASRRPPWSYPSRN
ncbi:hypothetical protein Ddc_22273 [Ditylenchus destructor]|nr:hypothetical protein Ddc_22273 [Ditylenchus destructor]